MSRTHLAVMAIAISTIFILTLLTIGCRETPDQRLADLAKQSLREQSLQNQRLLDESNQISQAARSLVASDAEARRELLAAHTGLQKELEVQRTRLDSYRAEMEAERRELAEQRGRDPIIAQTIGMVGTALACLLPLLLAGYVLYTVNRNTDSDHQFSQILVAELTSDQPRLLPLGMPLALEQPADDPSSEPEPVNAGV